MAEVTWQEWVHPVKLQFQEKAQTIIPYMSFSERRNYFRRKMEKGKELFILGRQHYVPTCL